MLKSLFGLVVLGGERFRGRVVFWYEGEPVLLLAFCVG